MNPQDFIDVVNELNEELPEEVYSEGIYYEYCTDGFTDIIKFANFKIFHSDFDTEERIEDVGGVKEYLVRKRNEFIDMLVKVKGKNIYTVYSGADNKAIQYIDAKS